MGEIVFYKLDTLAKMLDFLYREGATVTFNDDEESLRCHIETRDGLVASGPSFTDCVRHVYSQRCMEDDLYRVDKHSPRIHEEAEEWAYEYIYEDME